MAYPCVMTTPGARRRRWPWWILGGVLLLPALLLSCSPAAPRSPAPTAADVAAAREIRARLDRLRGIAEPAPFAATWRELAAVANLAGRTAGFENVEFTARQGRAELVGSLPLAPRLWLNGYLFVSSGDDGRPRASARVGLIRLPAPLVHAVIELAGRLLRARGADIAPLPALVTHFSVDATGVAATMKLPGRSRMFDTLRILASGGMDEARIAAHYCRIADLQRADPQRDFSVQVRRLFRGADGSKEDNQAAFVALAILVAGTDVGMLAKERQRILKQCANEVKGDFQLLGRADLVKHWSVSAAMAAVFGSQASLSVGTWKEIADSGSGGSGFSLVDLAADRSGVFCAERGVSKDEAEAMRGWLANATQRDLLPVSALALAEGMTEEQFRARFVSIDSQAYAAAMQNIDDALAVLVRPQDAK